MSKKYPILSVLLILILSGCYPEYKLAKSYIDSKPEISVMILPTNFVFKENLKEPSALETKGLNENEIEDLKFNNSIYLKQISDSAFLETFINSMIDEFYALGFTVFTGDQLATFLDLKTEAYILNIAQISLEEHYLEHKDEEVIGSYNYTKNIDLNAVTYNFWFELSKLNEEDQKTELLFVSETLSDQIDGFFNQNVITGDVKYKYHIRNLDLDAIYRYCDIFGQRYAGYTFDLLMNRHLEQVWGNVGKPQYYMQYKRWNNTLDMTTKDRFVIMDE